MQAALKTNFMQPPTAITGDVCDLKSRYNLGIPTLGLKMKSMRLCIIFHRENYYDYSNYCQNTELMLVVLYYS